MELASCTVILTKENHVPKQAVTPPEVAILRSIHAKNAGSDPVVNLKITKKNWKNYNPQAELVRLRGKYGANGNKVFIIDALFPGVAHNLKLLPQTFDAVPFIAPIVGDGNSISQVPFLPGEPGYEAIKAQPPVPQAPPEEDDEPKMAPGEQATVVEAEQAE